MAQLLLIIFLIELRTLLVCGSFISIRDSLQKFTRQLKPMLNLIIGVCLSLPLHIVGILRRQPIFKVLV
ncbi:hypothetical protein WL71_21605 [Burkholderia ubonensis]|uniref:Uncharacterized protein n=1 Tax=Burkholderia ubonensis TaxID=101571 RepID=A0A107GCP4_9BURK|nr:hypothetical protein WL71_21605 [Burkholderia ubonensis]KWD86123.1 hypothetical protein WL70_11985 [Burkholderia ubonensis]KWE02880.1 hypothetical protein WL72_07700 [Burkholderia ubonensis]KWE09425.1 hypothetical protein WL73_04495 [Burkholderia ubonensis]